MKFTPEQAAEWDRYCKLRKMLAFMAYNETAFRRIERAELEIRNPTFAELYRTLYGDINE